MKKYLKRLSGTIVASLLIAGCSGPGSQPKMDEQPEPVKESRIMLLMKTTQGDIKIELDAEKAPNTVANFMKYVESGHYNGTIFHRVISNFMIQGGGFTPDMSQKDAPHKVDNEANNGLKNEVGTIAMARTMDPHSASAQFFINTKDNGFLNFSSPTPQGWGYCVFGKVVDGMDVVMAIDGVKTGNAGGHGDVPLEPIVITEVAVID
jgi:peptidyl-prolyl cis-trans isomerase B (cyclophilin B)